MEISNYKIAAMSQSVYTMMYVYTHYMLPRPLGKLNMLLLICIMYMHCCVKVMHG